MKPFEPRRRSEPSSITRRTLLLAAAGVAAGAAIAPRTSSAQPSTRPQDAFIDLRRAPDDVTLVLPTGDATATRAGDDRWRAEAAQVRTTPADGALAISLHNATQPVSWIRLRWRGRAPAGWAKVLNDHWERGYGDLGWDKPAADRIYPWYLMASPTGNAADPAHGFGVQTRPAAMCHWTIDDDGLTLHCDVRSGGVGVELGDRALDVCRVVSRRGVEGESAFASTHAFCGVMCPTPRLADHVVYGFNDWYYAYGRQTPANLVADSRFLADLTAGIANRPYSVMDDGWQSKTKNVKGGQWSVGRETFPDMKQFAADIRGANVRPGLWFRPLLDELESWPAEWRSPRDGKILDASLPEVLEQVVARDVKRIVDEWGFELIKHDFSTIDILGRWGKDMRQRVAPNGWHFQRRDRTTAEIVNRFYDTIRNAAGERCVVIGCNTLSHLSAGVFELQRIGDDTSGTEWDRTLKMGVNSLAFRAPQEQTFYGADADCVGITGRIDWRLNKQWLELASQSGTPLFISAKRDTLNAEQTDALRTALAHGSQRLPLCEPLDWMQTPTPTRWRLNGQERTFEWA